MNTELLLTGHQEHQSDGGSADCRARADGQLPNGLVEQQQERVVGQAGGKIAAHGEKGEQKQQEVRHKSVLSDLSSLLPAGRASLNPQLDAEQTHSVIITHLDLFVVHRAEDCREKGKQ